MLQWITLTPLSKKVPGSNPLFYAEFACSPSVCDELATLKQLGETPPHWLEDGWINVYLLKEMSAILCVFVSFNWNSTSQLPGNKL